MALRTCGPNPVKPHPEKSVCGEEPKPTGLLAPQDAHLMSKSNELEFQGGAASEAESEDGNDGSENRDHDHNGTDMARKSLGSLGIWSFEQAQEFDIEHLAVCRRAASA
jgi:hypothetical protein